MTNQTRHNCQLQDHASTWGADHCQPSAADRKSELWAWQRARERQQRKLPDRPEETIARKPPRPPCGGGAPRFHPFPKSPACICLVI